MKLKYTILLLGILSHLNLFSQNVGINAINATPNASAMLDVSSTSKGLLIPRVTLTGTTDVTTITAAAISLLVYNTATITDITPGYYYWDGTVWVRMLEGGTNDFWKTTGNTGTTVGTNFIGTTDAQDFAINTNNTEKIRVAQNGNVGIGTINPIQKLDVRGIIRTEINQPTIHFYDADAPVNEKWWNVWVPQTDTFRIQALTDAGVGGGQVFDLIRSGNNLSVLKFGDSFSNQPTIYAQGNLGGYVGIGTNAPGEQLTIGMNNFVFHNGGDKAIGFNTDWTPTGQWTKIPGSNYQGRIHFNPATGDLGFISSDSLTNLNNLVDNRIFIQGGTGNVGIGTTLPLAKLHVFGGDLYVTDQSINNYSTSRSAFTLKLDNITSASDNGIRIYDGNSAGHIHIGNAGLSYIQSYGTASISSGTLGTSTLDFDDAANFERLLLNPLGGNVGIGTSSPTAKLSVNGTANKPGGGSWAVFSDRTLKKDINEFSLGLETLSKIHLVSYKYNDKYFDIFGESEAVRNSTYQGVIAQELQKIVPFMVSDKTADIYNKKGEIIKQEKVLEVDPSAFTYILINSVQELKKENEELKKENELLMRDIAIIKEKLGIK